MATPSVPYDYDSSQGVHYGALNANFKALTDGLSESTYDLDVSSIDASGNFSVTGTTPTIGTTSSTQDIHSLTTIDEVSPYVFGLNDTIDSQIVNASNEVTVEKAFTAITAAGATEDLNTINDNGFFDSGSLLILTGTAGKTITIGDTTGNIYCGGDIIIEDNDTMSLIKYVSDGDPKWLMMNHSDNG